MLKSPHVRSSFSGNEVDFWAVSLGKARIHDCSPEGHGKNSHWIHEDAEDAHEQQGPMLIGLEAYPEKDC